MANLKSKDAGSLPYYPYVCGACGHQMVSTQRYRAGCSACGKGKNLRLEPYPGWLEDAERLEKRKEIKAAEDQAILDIQRQWNERSKVKR